MANARDIASCKRCGNEGDHYTRSNGSKVSPCVVCSKSAAKAAVTAKADNPDYIDKRRAQYKRYNDSTKGKARLTRSKRHPRSEGDDESEAAGRAALMMSGFQA